MRFLKWRAFPHLDFAELRFGSHVIVLCLSLLWAHWQISYWHCRVLASSNHCPVESKTESCVVLAPERERYTRTDPATALGAAAAVSRGRYHGHVILTQLLQLGYKRSCTKQSNCAVQCPCAEIDAWSYTMRNSISEPEQNSRVGEHNSLGTSIGVLNEILGKLEKGCEKSPTTGLRLDRSDLKFRLKNSTSISEEGWNLNHQLWMQIQHVAGFAPYY